MLDEALASRFEFGTQAVEDKYGRHLSGRRLADDAPVVMTVLDPSLKIGPTEANAVSVASKKLAASRWGAALLSIEVGRTEGGNTYIVSESVGLESLKSLLRTSGGLTPAQALAIAYRVAATLKAASEVGVRHLDISSASIHVALEPEVKVFVARLGFANLLPTYNPARKNEAHHGTAEYMAPEVCAGRYGDESADLYGLGILLYEMIAGKPPFMSSSPSTTIKRQVYEKPLPLHLVKPGMGQLDAYERLVTRLLAKDPKGRPGSAAEVMEAIQALKNEAYGNAALGVEPTRATVVDVISHLEAELVVPVVATSSDPVPSGRETMVFTGLAEAIEKAQAAAQSQSSGAPAASIPAGGSRPTEAFDPSFVVAAVEAAQKAAAQGAGPGATESPEERTQALPGLTPDFIAAQSNVAAPDAESTQAWTAVSAPTPTSAAGLSESPTAANASEDWFIKGKAIAEASIPPEDRESRKETRMFWVVAAAVAILLAIAVAVYFESRPGGAPGELPVAPEVAPAVTPAPSPVTAPVPVPVPAPAPKPAVSAAPAVPVAAPVSPAVAPAVQVAVPVPAPAVRPESAVVPVQKAAPSTKPFPVEEKPAVKAATPPPKPAPAVKPAPVAKPAPAPEPQMSDSDRQDKVKPLIKAGRDAYNAGNYADAIAKYNEALAMDKGNALVRKLLEQAKAKLDQ
jgi:serine/threonine-protein kinase